MARACIKFWLISVLIVGLPRISLGVDRGSCDKGLRALVNGSLHSAAAATKLAVRVVTAPVAVAGKAKNYLFPKTSEARYKELRDTLVSSLLPANKPSNPELLFDTDVTDAQKQIFYDAFDEYLNNYDKYKGKYVAEKDFRKWWALNRDSLLTPPVLKALRDQNVHLNRFVDDAHTQFLADTGKLPLLSRIGHVLKHPLTLATGASLTVLVYGGTLLRDLAVLGPGVQILNAYLSSEVTPLAQTANQIGTQNLNWLATWTQTVLTKMDAKRRKKLAAELEGNLGHPGANGPEEISAEASGNAAEVLRNPAALQ